MVLDTADKVVAAGSARGAGAVIGVAGKDIALAGIGFKKGTEAFQVIQGEFRTRGLKEAQAEKVIDPKYFAGEKYPSIRRGQTAGQLRKEFFEPVLPGEQAGVGRAFTASPGDFPKLTTTQAGTSEVPGLFGSPKASPTFLKLKSEGTRLFGFDKPVGKPTLIRLKTKSVDFAPGIKASTKFPTGRYQKGFFKSIGGTGKSYIPFAKTEKELVTAFATPIKQTGSKYFIKFEGVKVPIKEYGIVGSTQAKTSFKLGDVVSSVSSRKITSTPYITPSSLGYSSLLSKSYSPKVSSKTSYSKIIKSSTIPYSGGR